MPARAAGVAWLGMERARTPDFPRSGPGRRQVQQEYLPHPRAGHKRKTGKGGGPEVGGRRGELGWGTSGGCAKPGSTQERDECWEWREEKG